MASDDLPQIEELPGDSPAQIVCIEYWGPAKRRCQGCPIESECGTPVVPLNRQTLDAYCGRLNEAALVVLRETPEGAERREQ